MLNFTNCWTRVKTGSLSTVNGLKCAGLGLVDIVHGLLNLVWLGSEPVVAAKRSRSKKAARRSR
jgi:hypothetical protein